MIPRTLRDAGVLGLNERNRNLVQRWNPRTHLPIADDKIETKRACERAGVSTPELIGVVDSHSALRRIADMLEDVDEFALKPAHGAQGNGILIVTGRRDGRFVSSRGRTLGLADLRYRASEILAGRFSLAGQEDEAFFEELLRVHSALGRICSGGVPDIRVIVYRGVPVMAMARLPSERSRGRANLHKGAVGAGIDLHTGELSCAVHGDRFVDAHPDTGERVVGTKIPEFQEILRQAVRASDCSRLGYVGVDLVLDEARGPVVLELNARPGLSIQIANQAGMVPRLGRIDAFADSKPSLDDRLALGRSLDADGAGG